MYSDLGHMDGWRDHTARLHKLRREIAGEILQGTLDKFGNSRDNEKRAVLFLLEKLISYPVALAAEFDSLTRKKAEMEEKARIKTGIHNKDRLYSPLDV